jgi:hypothetical protein
MQAGLERRGEIVELGPIAVAYWSPKLGEAPDETYVKRPRRLTATFSTEWWKPRTWRFACSHVRTPRV